MPAKLTTEKFIKRSREIHGDKYGYDKVVYINSDTPVVIECPEHGEFKQRPSAHSRGNGCPKCSRIKCTTEDFIKEARKIMVKNMVILKSFIKGNKII